MFTGLLLILPGRCTLATLTEALRVKLLTAAADHMVVSPTTYQHHHSSSSTSCIASIWLLGSAATTILITASISMPLPPPFSSPHPPAVGFNIDNFVRVHYGDPKIEPLSPPTTTEPTAAKQSKPSRLVAAVARWRWLIILLVVAAIGAAVAVPVVLLTTTHHNTSSTTTPSTVTSGASQTTTTEPTTTAVAATLPPAVTHAQVGQLSFAFNGSTSGVGFNPNVFAFAHSAGTEQTVQYSITNTGNTTLSDVVVTLTMFPGLQKYTVDPSMTWSPLPNVVANVYANIPYTLTIASIAPLSTLIIMTNGGWYMPVSGAYYDVQWLLHYNSSVPMLNVTDPSLASVSQSTRITGPVTAAPTTQPASAGPTTPPTPAPTHRPAPPGIPTAEYIYNPGPLPTPYANQTVTSTVGISSAALNVVTQGGNNNFYRQHYYADPASYISAASVIATNSLNVQIAPLWELDTTPLLSAAMQALVQQYNHPQQFRHQPLIWQNWVIMGGDLNTLFAINADDTTQVHTNQLAVPFNQYLSFQSYGLLCTDQVFEGLTAAGVIDLDTNTFYTVTKTYNPPSSTKLEDTTFYLLAMSLPNLQEQWRMEINRLQYYTATFNAGWQQQRSSLTLLNGVLYLPFGAQCDYGFYRGWLVGVQLSTRSIVHVFATALGNQQGGGGLWGTGSGPASDSNGRLFAVTANSWGGHVSPGYYDDYTGDLSILSSTPNWSENDNTVLRFDTSTLHQTDFFTPFNSDYMDGDARVGAVSNDQDLGASSLAILPTSWGGAQYPHLGVVGGKNSTLYLLNLDNLGGYRMGPGRTDAVLSEAYLFDISGTACPMASSPSVSVADGLIYCALAGDQIYAFKVVVNSAGVPQLTLAGRSRVPENDLVVAGTSTPMVLTSGKPGDATLWVAFGQGLHILSGIPDSTGTLQLIGLCKLLQPQGFAQAAFYNHGVVAPNTLGLIKYFQFSG